VRVPCFWRLAAVTGIASLLASCGMSESREESIAVADRYFAAMSTGDVAAALRFYSEKFFATTPRPEFERTLTDLTQRCGKVTSHKLASWATNSTIGTNAGSTTMLLYDVQYSACETSETMKIFKADGGAPQIVAHAIKVQQGKSQHAGKPSQTI